MGNGLDLLAIPGDQMGTREKCHEAGPYLARQLSVSRPGGPDPTSDDAACSSSQILMQEATQSRTGLFWFRPWDRTSSKGVCESTVLSCTGGDCSRGYWRGERGRKAHKSLLEKELIEACANIGGLVVLSVAYYHMVLTATPLKEARLLLL